MTNQYLELLEQWEALMPEEKAGAAPQMYQYQMTRVNSPGNMDADAYTQLLNDMGAQGWQLVAVASEVTGSARQDRLFFIMPV